MTDYRASTAWKPAQGLVEHTCQNPRCNSTYYARPRRKYCTHVCYTQTVPPWTTSFRKRYQVTDQGRICIDCAESKPWDDFRQIKRGPYGRDARCRACYRIYLRLKRYKLSRDEFLWLHKLHDGQCALCGRAERKIINYVVIGRAAGQLSVDHDHACTLHGREHGCKSCIRGLLCEVCNTRLLSIVEASPLLRPRFADYLTRRPFKDYPNCTDGRGNRPVGRLDRSRINGAPVLAWDDGLVQGAQ